MVYGDAKANLVFYVYGEDGAPVGDGKGAQDFNDILKECREKGEKFTDPHFPPNDDSIGNIDLPLRPDGTPQEIKWFRPTEIAQALFQSEPIFHGEYNQFGVIQGQVGDCWFLGALADAATHPDCINTLVPEDNQGLGFDTGVFHFRFWSRGSWVDIAIDDNLPCCMLDGKILGTALTRPTKDGGFWAALLEKAYAKLYGKYEYIKGGFSNDAMLEFTGGFVESIHNDELVALKGDLLKDKIFSILDKNGLVGIGTGQIPAELQIPHDRRNPGNEHQSREGIVGTHAYSVLDIQDVTDDTKKTTTLIKCRNPWGSYVEWVGPFCDYDDKSWKTGEKDLRTGSKTDGQFWIPIENMRPYIATLYTCLWKGGYRGDHTFKDSFWINYIQHSSFKDESSGQLSKFEDLIGKPGYYLHLKENPENKGKGECIDGEYFNCGISVYLMHKGYKASGLNSNLPLFGVIYLTAKGEIKFDADFIPNIRKTAGGSKRVAKGSRDLSFQADLPAGTVALFPWIYEDGDGSATTKDYLIRIVAEADEVLEI